MPALMLNKVWGVVPYACEQTHKQLKMTICPNMPIIGTKPNHDYGINIFRNFSDFL